METGEPGDFPRGPQLTPPWKAERLLLEGRTSVLGGFLARVNAGLGRIEDVSLEGVGVSAPAAELLRCASLRPGGVALVPAPDPVAAVAWSLMMMSVELPATCSTSLRPLNRPGGFTTGYPGVPPGRPSPAGCRACTGIVAEDERYAVSVAVEDLENTEHSRFNRQRGPSSCIY